MSRHRRDERGGNGRLVRVQEEIRREVGEILHRRASDPRLSWVSIMRVEASRDLASAKVFVSVLGDESDQVEALRALEHAAPFVRTELGHQLRMRRVPELRFLADRGIEHSLGVQKILDQLGMSGEEEE